MIRSSIDSPSESVRVGPGVDRLSGLKPQPRRFPKRTTTPGGGDPGGTGGITGGVVSAVAPVVNVQESADASGFPGSDPSRAEAFTKTRYDVDTASVGRGSTGGP